MTGMCNGKHRNPTGRVPSIALGLVVFVVWWLTEQVKTPTVQDMHATARSSGGNTIRLETTAAASAAAASPLIRHVYVVGCGHSGTSVLKRTVANLPGMMCIPQESQLWISKTGRRRRVALQVAEWDAAAAASGMRSWVEKTPKHIERLKQIWAADPEALVVCVIRDGLDVAASLVERRVPLQDAMQRWVQDNAAVLPHLEDPRLLRVSYEEFASQATVLRVLRQLAQFVGAEPVSDDRLLLALQPPSAALPSGHQCEAYPGEGAKLADLSASYLQLLGVRGQGTRGDPPPNKSTFHNRYRSWQASQAWAPQQEASRWHHRLSCGQQAAAAQHNELLKMLQRLGYSLQALPEQTNGTACQQPPTGGLPAQAAVAGGAGGEPAAGAVPAEGPEHAPTPDSLVLPL